MCIRSHVGIMPILTLSMCILNVKNVKIEKNTLEMYNQTEWTHYQVDADNVFI